MMFLQSVVLAFVVLVGLAVVIYTVSMMRWISKDYPEGFKTLRNWFLIFCCVTILIHIIRLMLS